MGVERGGSHLLTTPQQHSSSTSSSSAAPPQVTDHISAASSSSSSSKAGKVKGNPSKGGWGWGKSKSKSSQHGTAMQLDLPQIDGGTLLVEEDGCTIRHPEPGALLGVIQSQQPFTLAAAAASAAKQKQKQQCAYFEVEVLEVGCSPDTQSSGVACVAIGLAPGGYPSDCLPGWLEGSVGYHGDDGGCEHSTTTYT